MSSPTAPPSSAEAAPRLHQGLGLWDSASLIIGSMIGSGIFIVPAQMARDLPGGAGLLLLGWVLTGILTVCGALSYGELAAMMPKAGGQYVYLKEAYGRMMGFLYGWTLFTVIQTGVIAAVAVAFARFLGVFVPAIGTEPLVQIGRFGVTPQQVVAIGVIGFLTLSNFREVKQGALVQNVFTAVKVVALLAVVAMGLWFGLHQPQVAERFHTEWPTFSIGTLGTFFSAMVGSAFSADSWNNITFTAGEVRNPQRNLPLSLVVGTGAVIILYVLANIAYVAALGMPAIAAAPQDRVGTELMARVLGEGGRYAMAGLILVSTFGCLNGIILAGGRVYYAMAQDGLFFRSAARLNRHGVPANALAFQALWAALLTLTGSYGDLLDYVMFAVLLFYIFTVVGLMRLRRQRPEWPRPYKVLFYPVVPILYCLLAGGICLALLVYKPAYAGSGLLLVLAGAVVYAVFGKERG